MGKKTKHKKPDWERYWKVAVAICLCIAGIASFLNDVLDIMEKLPKHFPSLYQSEQSQNNEPAIFLHSKQMKNPTFNQTLNVLAFELAKNLTRVQAIDKYAQQDFLRAVDRKMIEEKAVRLMLIDSYRNIIAAIKKNAQADDGISLEEHLQAFSKYTVEQLINLNFDPNNPADLREMRVLQEKCKVLQSLTGERGMIDHVGIHDMNLQDYLDSIKLSAGVNQKLHQLLYTETPLPEILE